MEYIGLGVYGLFILWFIWVIHRESRGQQISAVRTIPGAEADAGTEAPSEEAASEDLQGQRG